MAWYRIAFRPSVEEDLRRLDAPMAQRLFDKTKWLASNIGNLRHEPIAEDLTGLCKYAVGEWRIYYTVDRGDQFVDIHAVVRQEPR
jgi:mRNA interferase RelE/StbE